MKEAKERGFMVGVKTNALIFDNEEKIAFFCRYVDHVYLSIDSPQEKIHNYLRGNKDSFARNINLVKFVKRNFKSVKIFFNTVITNINYKTLPQLLDLAHSLKVDKVSFVHLNTKNKRDIKDIRLSKEQFNEFYFQIWPQILKKSRSFNIPVNVDPYFCSLLEESIEEQIRRLKSNSSEFDEEIDNFSKGLYGKKFYSNYVCYGVWDHITIDWEGNVYPCCAMPRNRNTRIGNIFYKKFSQLWNTEKYKKYREQILRGNCKFKNQCSRYFKYTLKINKYIKEYLEKFNNINYTKEIIDSYLQQVNYNPDSIQDKLKMMIYYSFIKSDFYRNKFKSKIRLGERIKMQSLPIITREQVKEAFSSSNIVCNYYEEPYGVFKTSSQGRQAFHYARPLNLKRYPHMYVCFLFTDKWKIGDKWLKLTGVNSLNTVNPLKTDNAQFLPFINLEIQQILVPPSDNYLKEPRSKIKKIYTLIKNSNACVIHANPTYLKFLLNRFWRENLKLNGEFAVNSTYELLLPSTEKLICKYINCYIQDQYGCSEVGPIGFRCREGNYHIFVDSVYVELVPAKDLDREDVGRIVVTDLRNKIMPFVKYFTGDYAYIVKNKECKCGLKTPFIGKILGRESQIIFYKGKCYFPLEIDSIFYTIDNVLHYRISFFKDVFLVEVVREDSNKFIDIKQLRENFLAFFDDARLNLKIKIVEEILPSVRGGKYYTVRTGRYLF